MRIGIDAHALGTQAGGNETFIRELLYGLLEIAPDYDIIPLVFREFAEKGDGVGGYNLAAMPQVSSWLRVPFVLPWVAWRNKLDLLHVQYIAPPVCPCPFVVTVHDVVWEVMPELMTPLDVNRLKRLVPHTVRRAARVFAVTDAMREAISQTYDYPRDRIDLVQTSIDPRFMPITDPQRHREVRRKHGIDGPFVLYIGALQPRKNLLRLAQAFAQLDEVGLDHKLVVVGKKAWLYDDMLQGIEALNLGDRIVFTGYIDGEDLPTLLTMADAFAYVSLYEGYGLPVLEAMACGTPVLTSTDPALTEVTGGHAVYADPLNVDHIANGLTRILSESELRQRLQIEGPQRAGQFTRHRMARQALEAYGRALMTAGRG